MNTFRRLKFIVIVLLCIWTCVVFIPPRRSHSLSSFVPAVPEKNNYSFSSFELKYVEENLNSLDQANPHLIRYTRMKYLTPPSTQPYNLDATSSNETKTPLAEWFLKFYRDKMNGVFIEAGAHNGENNSNTLYLEKELGWTGLLVECNPELVSQILTKNRKAWVANVCLAPNSRPGTFNFSRPNDSNTAGTIGKPLARNAILPQVRLGQVQAMPLYTLIAALGWKEIDFFSFDIEGIELELIRNFPFDKVIFKVIVVEIQYYTFEQLQEMKRIFEKNDYIFVDGLSIDHMFAHKSIRELIPKFYFSYVSWTW